MAYLKTNRIVGGESNDVAMEVPTEDESGSVVTINSTGARVTSGTYSVLFPTNTAGAKAICRASSTITYTTPTIVVLMGSIGMSTTPTSAVGIVTDNNRIGGGGEHYIEVNTSLQLQCLDAGGNLVGQPSLDTISTSGMTDFMVVYDFSANQTPSNTSAFMTMFVNGKYQWDGLVQGSTLLPATTLWWGEYMEAGGSRGADFYGDDLTVITSTVPATDAPHIYAIPKLTIEGLATRPPTGDGTHTTWAVDESGTPGAAAANYDSADDFPNDGDTTWVGSTTNSEKETYTCSAANPITSSDTVWAVEYRAVLRTVGAAKTAYNLLLRDGSGNETTGADVTVGTSYVGVSRRNVARPAGGDWVYTDFDLSGGISTLQFGGVTPASGTIAFRLTSQPSPGIIHYSETRPMSIGWV